MIIEVEGVTYSRFVNAVAVIRLDALSNTFSFTAVSTKGAPLPFKGGERCKVLIGNNVIITGSIEVVDGSYSADSHIITVQGRDSTGDVVDSTLSDMSNLTSPISLKSIIEKVLENIGSDIVVIDDAEPELFNKAEDLTAPEAGVNAFEFIENKARKRQVILTSNSAGNIVISRTPGDTINSIILQNVPGATGNNIIAASYSYDLTGRFNVYKMLSSLNIVSLSNSGATSDTVSICEQVGAVTDDEIRKGRKLAMLSEGAYSAAQNDSRAEWEKRIRRARGKLYSATLQGHTILNTGDLWQINKVINVFDDIAGIHSEMLINTITYSLSLEKGSLTTLSLIRKNAYNLMTPESKTSEIGAGLAQ